MDQTPEEDPFRNMFGASGREKEELQDPESVVKAQLGGTKGGGSASALDPKGEPPEVNAPPLTRAELEEMLQLKNYLDQKSLSEEMTRQSLEYQRKALERNRQVEQKLKPLDLKDLLFETRVQQEIPIADGYSLQFQTISANTSTTIESILPTAVERWYGAHELKHLSLQQRQERVAYLARVADLTAGLVMLSGSQGPAGRVNLADSRTLPPGEDRDRIVEAFFKEMSKLMEYPPELLDDMIAHQAAFHFRVRKAFSHAGWVESQVGKS